MKLCKFFSIMLILIPISLNAQIQVRLHQPPPNQLKIEHLWWVDLTNSTQTTYSVYLRAEVTEARKGLIFRASSNTFTLTQGKKRITARDIKDVTDVWYSSKYKEFIVRTGGVPEGDYTACIYVMNTRNKQEIGSNCLHHVVRQPGFPRLISPKDGVTLKKEKAPLFTWTRPTPLPQGEQVTYTLRIVEVLKGQIKEEAIRSNPPWYEEKGIGRTSLRYPTRAKAFDEGKEYAWQIQAFDRSGYSLGENNGKSEIWQFKFVETIGKPLVTLLIPEKLSGKANIKADVRHTKGIDRVVFFLDGKPMFTDYSRPFEWVLDTKSLDEGSHSFLAQGFDFRGNMGEDRHYRDVQYRFPMSLSPVRVRIVTPEIITPGARVEVYGDVPIEVEVTHNLDYGIKNITFMIVDEETDDVDTICERVYASGYYLDPIMKRTWIKTGYPEPPINTTCVWNAGVEWGSNYLIDVSAQDEYGNWGRASRLTTIARPRVPAIPQIRITRSVTRSGNYFEVTLTIENPRDVAIHDIHIEDENSGFQCIKTAWSQSMNSDGTWPSSMAKKESEVEYNVVSKSTTLSATFRYLEAGRSCRLRYYVVPILFSFDESVSYIIGESTSFSYRVGDRNFSGDFDSQSHDALSGPSNVDLAFMRADYLIVTNAAALFAYGYGRDDVNELLSTMAELAKEKNGVLGYISFPAYAYALRNLIRESPPGSWYEKLAPFDYLLLVGETEIVPSFYMEFLGCIEEDGSRGKIHVRLSDNPYADIYGNDGKPELRVGRIIGNTAHELLIPIMTSINVHRGILAFDRSNALVVTGGGDIQQHCEAAGDQLRNILHDNQKLGLGNITMVYSGQIAGDNLCEKMEAIGSEVKNGAVGKDIIAWMGHGGPGSWGWCLDAFVSRECPHPTAMYVDHSPALGFGTVAPMVFAASCFTGYYEGASFGYCEDGENGIAEAFLKKGAAVYVGCNRSLSGASANEFQRQFFENYWTTVRSVGDALFILKNHLINVDINDPSNPGFQEWLRVCHIFNLYGDPKFGGE